jgi:hypothetical protein
LLSSHEYDILSFQTENAVPDKRKGDSTFWISTVFMMQKKASN